MFEVQTTRGWTLINVMDQKPSVKKQFFLSHTVKLVEPLDITILKTIYFYRYLTAIDLGLYLVFSPVIASF